MCLSYNIVQNVIIIFEWEELKLNLPLFTQYNYHQYFPFNQIIISKRMSVLIQTKNTSTNNNDVIIESETADSEATIDSTVLSSLDLPLTVAKKSNVNK